MHLVSQKTRNGELTKVGIEACLCSTPYEGFMHWILNSHHFVDEDRNKDGAIDIGELRVAGEHFYSSNKAPVASAPGPDVAYEVPLQEDAAAVNTFTTASDTNEGTMLNQEIQERPLSAEYWQAISCSPALVR